MTFNFGIFLLKNCLKSWLRFWNFKKKLLNIQSTPVWQLWLCRACFKWKEIKLGPRLDSSRSNELFSIQSFELLLLLKGLLWRLFEIRTPIWGPPWLNDQIRSLKLLFKVFYPAKTKNILNHHMSKLQSWILRCRENGTNVKKKLLLPVASKLKFAIFMSVDCMFWISEKFFRLNSSVFFLILPRFCLV